jgi:hypothetical protein
MPLTTNNCREHGGHVEDKCPECEREAYANNLDEAKRFMERNHRLIVFTDYEGKKVRVEDLFQYFRALIIDEINRQE